MAAPHEYSPLPPWPRTDYCGALRATDAGREVALWGWVASRRDHGGLIFIDLRDREGLLQLVFNPAQAPAAHEVAGRARSEYYLAARGKVVMRSEGTVNAELPTGEVEIAVTEAHILNSSQPPPFPVDADATAEDVRLRYRYIDLRRPAMQRNLRRRALAVQATRSFLDGTGFVEIETPILWRATPEGARDYLVPSRVNPGRFYALPQSPQLLKQLLMVSGFDRYYQIARCFRDEDLRANRQPEFSQIDIEMTCPRVDDVVATGEGMMAEIYRRVLGIELKLPFLRLPYAEAMERFGVDKPDMRFAMELKNLSAAFAGTQFKVFAEVLGRGESIYGIVLPAAYQLSRRELDEMIEGVRARYGLGLAYAKVASDGWQGPIARHLGDAERTRAARGGRPGDGRHVADGRGSGRARASDPRRFAPSARRQIQAARDGRAQISVGGRIPAARVQRRGEADGRGQSSVHRAASRRPRPAGFGPAEGARARLRHGAQRRGVGRRLDSYP